MSRLVHALLIAGAFLYTLSSTGRALELYDEGIILAGASGILKGQVPYRDFWTMYAPGQFYLVALIWKALGASAMTVRVVDCLFKAVLAWLLFVGCKNVAGGKVALGIWILTTLWLERIGLYGYPLMPSLTFALAGMLLQHKLLFNTSPASHRTALACGAIAGLSLLFRQDIGLYHLIVSLAMVMLGLYLLGQPAMGKPLRFMLYGIAAITLPVILIFSVAVSPALIIEQLIVFPIEIFSKVRSLPFPSPLQALSLNSSWEPNLTVFVGFYFPVVVALISALTLLRIAMRKQPEFPWIPCWLLFFLLLLFNQARFRSDFAHVVPLYFPSFILSAWLLYSLYKLAPLARIVPLCLTLVLLLPLSATPIKSKLNDPPLSGLTTRDQIQAAGFVKTHSLPGERIFVGCPEHSTACMPDLAFYFLSDRLSATQYRELHPGLATEERVQSAIIAELEQTGTRLVVLRPAQHPQDPNEPEIKGSGKLDNHLRQNFRELRQFGDYRILEKAGASSRVNPG